MERLNGDVAKLKAQISALRETSEEQASENSLVKIQNKNLAYQISNL